jgi:uncharacterized protein YkwD
MKVGGGAALVLALTAMSGTAAASTSACAGADVTPTRENVAVIRAAITCLVNQERVSRGLPVLRTVGLLRDVAARHSADMVRRGYFSHITPTGVNVRARLARGGVHRVAVGENIAWALGYESTPLSVVTSWMHSPGHRANILSRRYTATGIGVALGAPGHPEAAETATITQVFAGR